MSTKALIKNTMFLYIRMIIIMGVNLYTSRIILEYLGVEDFGIYNLVGGIIVSLSFLSGSMSLSINRFIAYELGLDNIEKVKKIFSVGVNIQVLIAILALIIGETIGLWFVNTQLNIPDNRMFAANIVYQVSIVVFILTSLRVPYQAVIIANEKMRFYAYIGILEGILLLLAAFLLSVIPFDKLIVYAVLFAVVTLILNVVYYLFCRLNFSIYRYNYKNSDKVLFKEMSTYAGISTYGNLSTVFVLQGQNILLNIFFGPICNAARAIAYQIQTATTVMINNVYTAATPQITKSYAADDREYLEKTVNRISIFTIICLSIFIIPVSLNLPYLLELWLGNEVPEQTVGFMQLIFIDIILVYCCRPLLIAIQSSLKILKLHIYTGTLVMLNIPAAYLVFKFCDASAETIFIIKNISSVFFVIIVLYLAKTQINWDVKKYFTHVLLKSLVASVSVFCIVFLISNKVTLNVFPFLKFIIEGAVAFILLSLISYFFLVNREERYFIKKWLIEKFR